MATRFGRKGRKGTTEEPAKAAEVDQQPAVIDAAQVSLADDAPDTVSEATEAVEAATQSETDGTQEIDAKFQGQDFGVEEQLAEMIGQTTSDEDPLTQFAGIDTAFGGATGRERLAEFAAELTPDDSSQEAGPKYGKDMIADGSSGGGSTVTSGHPGAYGIVTNKDGEVTGHYAVAPDDGDGTYFGIDVAAMAYDKEMTKKADEVQQNRGSGGSGSGSGGSGSGSGTGGSGSAPGGSGTGGSSAAPTTVDNGDGSITTTYSDGTSITTNADGSQAVIHPDGSMDLYDKDGNLVEHQDPPPKEDPPPADDTKDDDEKDDGKDSVESQPDEDYIDPETERLLREELAQNPQLAYYQKSKQNDGVTDPADDEPGFQVAPGAEVPDMRAKGHEMFGQPAGDDFGGHRDTPSESGYWNDPNHGAVDPGPDQDAPTGPTRNDDPFDRDPALEPPASADTEEPTGDGGGSFLPPSDIVGPVDAPPDLPDIVIEEPAP